MARPLRVALVHSYYDSRTPGGENVQVDAEHLALERAGFEVGLFAARTDDLSGDRLYPVRTALRVATGRGSSPLAAVRAFRPDVVHVHNLFPNYGRRWVHDLDVPLVATLHNFRFACAAASIFRDGHVCTDCPDGHPLSALRHRCYRGSVTATLPLTLANRGGPAADPVIGRADRLLCILPRQRELLARAGLPAERLVAWSNFLPAALVPPAPEGASALASRLGCLYVGRLTPEKGVSGLVGNWSGEVPLTVVGDGPLRGDVERAARGRDVTVVGTLPREEVLGLVRRSTALAVPSLWPEAMTLTAIEALACGVPVLVAHDAETATDVVEQGIGRAVESPAGYARAAAALAGDAEAPARCRAVFEARYTEARWAERTTVLYRALAAGAPAGGETVR